MSERQCGAGITETQRQPTIRPGIEGFADGMRIFPRLNEWENQIALGALREGKTVDNLRTITPFRQYLPMIAFSNFQRRLQGAILAIRTLRQAIIPTDLACFHE